GFLNDDPLVDALGVLHEGPRTLGGTSGLESVVRAHDVDRVVFASSRLPASEQIHLFQRCIELGVQVDVIVPRCYDVIGSAMRARDVDGLLLVGLRPRRLADPSRLLKRSIDLGLSSALLVAFAPVLAYLALRIALDSPGPVLFRQERMGYAGRRFSIVKFRTMYVDDEQCKADFAHLNKHTEPGPRMFKIPDDPR